MRLMSKRGVRGLGLMAGAVFAYCAGVGDLAAKPGAFPKKPPAAPKKPMPKQPMPPMVKTKITSVTSGDGNTPSPTTAHNVILNGVKFGNAANGRGIYLGCDATSSKTWRAASSISSWTDTRIVAHLRGSGGLPYPCRLFLAIGKPVKPTKAAPTTVALEARIVTYIMRNDLPDNDGDGSKSIAFRGDDCDDYDPNNFPGRPEVPDFVGHDEDCDPDTIGVLDNDHDTFTDSRVYNKRRDGLPVKRGEDCDDTRREVRPGQIEACNNRDDNCNGQVDEELLNCPH